MACFFADQEKEVKSGGVVMQTALTTCYLMYSCYINTSLHRLTADSSATSPLVQSGVGGVAKILVAQSKARIQIFSSLLLWVVRLKSDKYQPEHLTSVSHFKRTTVEATFGLRVD